MKILILNGPNLNLLQFREARYGQVSFEQYLSQLRSTFTEDELVYHQTNHEGDLIDTLQHAADSYDGVVLNAGGYTHTSVALRDAIAAIQLPVVEVHITDILNREPFRQTSLIAAECIGSIIGFGLTSYDLGIRAIQNFYLPKE